MLRTVAVLWLAGLCSAAPASDPGQLALSQDLRQDYGEQGLVSQDPQRAEQLVEDFENEVVKMYTLKTLAEGLKLEQAAEEKIIEAAVETLQEEPSPERTQRLQEVGELLRRDKRALEALSGLIGSSSGGGGGASASAGSDSGSILNLVGPLLGSSSGGGGGGGGSSGGDGASAAGGSDSGSILNLVGPLLSSSSAGGGGGGASIGAGASVGGGDGASAAAGSDSGSILGLIGPLLSSSSAGGGGGGAGGDGASVSASAGSDSGSILNLIVPLLSSSSSSGGGGGGGILGVSSSSSGGGGGGGGVAVEAGGHGGEGAGIIGQIKGAKIALVGDKINLLMRVKFGVVNKILTLITNKIAKLSLPPHEANNLSHLQYPH